MEKPGCESGLFQQDSIDSASIYAVEWKGESGTRFFVSRNLGTLPGGHGL